MASVYPCNQHRCRGSLRTIPDHRLAPPPRCHTFLGRSQTQASAPDAGEPTVIVVDDKATAFAGLAWSDADDDETFSFDPHDRTTFWLRLYVGTIAVVVVVLGVTLWYVLSQRAEPEPVAAPRTTTTTAMVPT
jgi:hypothetical protein